MASLLRKRAGGGDDLRNEHKRVRPPILESSSYFVWWDFLANLALVSKETRRHMGAKKPSAV